ncbi:YciI family protein [Amaricoccus sp. W119]|uniref:YciI family protein n=1 Tax=Amaricoccus sp. W119 TaxID=3391833 RepID=UPI0039A680B5
MRFVVHCLDKPGATSLRLRHYDEHKAHLATGAVATVISGPLLADDGETMIGSLFIFEAETRQEIETFNRADPFNRAGIWASVSIHPFLMRVDNRA